MASVENGPKPATDPRGGGLTPNVTDTRRRAVLAGHEHDSHSALVLLRDPDPSVRVAALGSVSRAGALAPDIVVGALRDGDWRVRRRACEVSAQLTSKDPDEGSPSHRDVRYGIVAALLAALGDAEPLVAESAAWALGELLPASSDDEGAPATGGSGTETSLDAIASLGDMATNHRDPLCREAAVASLGAIGSLRSLDAVLAALDDKPPIRRRAVVALAAFDDPRAEASLEKCLSDRDWQVRQAAEDLRPRP